MYTEYNIDKIPSITGYTYTGLLDGRVIKINPKTETFDVVTRMGDPPYDDCGESVVGRVG